MNKTVFVMDSSGNAVQWAAGMSLEPKEVAGVVWVCVDPSTYTIHTTDPRSCISHFVRALCACPDGSLLEWDEEKGVVECKTWAVATKAVSADNPAVATPDLLGFCGKSFGTFTGCTIVIPKPETPIVVATPDPVKPTQSAGGWPEEWRELGDDEVIAEGDCIDHDGIWNTRERAFGWVGQTTRWAKTGVPSFPDTKAWRKVEPPSPVANPEPALLPDGRPVIPVTGHPKWRELYDDEVIQEGDRWSVTGDTAWEKTKGVIGYTTGYYKNRDGRQFPECKACRRIKPKKQKKAGGG